MPYIKQEDKNSISTDYISVLAAEIGDNPGKLNFVITCLINEALELSQNPSYLAISQAVTALECAKLELYRRIAGPYEDKKIKENGDVY